MFYALYGRFENRKELAAIPEIVGISDLNDPDCFELSHTARRKGVKPEGWEILG